MMLIRICQASAGNWLLIAENINDPQEWTRFLPCHQADSERFKFDSTVKQSLDKTPYAVRLCKPMLVRGKSVHEYEWTMPEEDILAHAMDIAETLHVELLIG